MRAERKAPEDGGRQPDSDSAPRSGRAWGRGRPLTGGPQATVKERERDMTGWAERGKETAGWAEKKEERRKCFPFSKLIHTISN